MKFILFVALMFSSKVFGAAPLHSKVEVKFQVEKNVVEFKIIPNSGLVINEEGPWKVEITESSKAEFKKKVAARSDFDLKTGSALLALSKKPEKTANAKYKFIGFVCTSDKSKCYRDIHIGEIKF